MAKTKLKYYRRQVDTYFGLEFSDIPLAKVLFRLPEKYSRKLASVIRLHHRLEKPPADAAEYCMRILRGPCPVLIVGQLEDREQATDTN
jgi:hypothetical protein